MRRSAFIALVVVPISLLATPTWADCPPKPKKPCNIGYIPPPKKRTGPIYIPAPDQFANKAEYRQDLALRKARSDSDLKAGLISQKLHDDELKSINSAMKKANLAMTPNLTVNKQLQLAH